MYKEKKRKTFFHKHIGLFLFAIMTVIFLLSATAYYYYVYKPKAQETLDLRAKKNEVLEKPIVQEAVIHDEVKSFIEKIVLGQSTDGKDIIGYVAGSGTETILLFGSIHGNEMGPGVLLNTFTNYLIENKDTLSANKRLVIIPILNPDGYFDRVDKLNSSGVNLNINFDTPDWTVWGGEEGNYAGPKPFSEPESRLIRDVVENYKPTKMISYHSLGSLSNPEDNDESRELAYQYALDSGYYYYNDPYWDFGGTATKWFLRTTGGAAITIELNDHYSGDWEINKPALLNLIK